MPILTINPTDYECAQTLITLGLNDIDIEWYDIDCIHFDIWSWLWATLTSNKHLLMIFDHDCHHHQYVMIFDHDCGSPWPASPCDDIWSWLWPPSVWYMIKIVGHLNQHPPLAAVLGARLKIFYNQGGCAGLALTDLGSESRQCKWKWLWNVLSIIYLPNFSKE